jgi:hypothetical protein
MTTRPSHALEAPPKEVHGEEGVERLGPARVEILQTEIGKRFGVRQY